MMLTCPIIHHGLMTPDGEGEWFCRQCGRRLYKVEDQVVGAHDPQETGDRPLRPYELVRWCKALRARGLSNAEIVKMTGRPSDAVQAALKKNSDPTPRQVAARR